MTAGRSVARRMIHRPTGGYLSVDQRCPEKRQNSQKSKICETDKTKEETQGN